MTAQELIAILEAFSPETVVMGSRNGPTGEMFDIITVQRLGWTDWRDGKCVYSDVVDVVMGYSHEEVYGYTVK